MKEWISQICRRCNLQKNEIVVRRFTRAIKVFRINFKLQFNNFYFVFSTFWFLEKYFVSLKYVFFFLFVLFYLLLLLLLYIFMYVYKSCFFFFFRFPFVSFYFIFFYLFAKFKGIHLKFCVCYSGISMYVSSTNDEPWRLKNLPIKFNIIPITV